MPYKTQITNASESLKINYDKIKIAINKLHTALNGTNFDKTCENVEKLFKKAETEFMNNSDVTVREQIEFYYQLRAACVELGELKAYLTQYINLKIEDLKKKQETELTTPTIQLPDLKQEDVMTLKKVA